MYNMVQQNPQTLFYLDDPLSSLRFEPQPFFYSSFFFFFFTERKRTGSTRQV